MTAPAAFPSPVGSRAVTPPPDARELVRRAREWRLSDLEATCDVISRWDHGLVARSSRYPSTYAYNAVLVESPLDWTLDALIAFAEEALGDLTHRRVDFAVDRDGEPYRDGFESRGWESLRTVRMRHRGRLPDAPDVAISEVPYEATIPLRMRWHEEDFPGVASARHFDSARELALSRDVRTFAVIRRRRSDRLHPARATRDRRRGERRVRRPGAPGGGLGTALAAHATRAAPPARDLWIAADAEDRPRRIYARLGYRPVHHDLGFVLMGVAPRGESAA